MNSLSLFESIQLIFEETLTVVYDDDQFVFDKIIIGKTASCYFN